MFGIGRLAKDIVKNLLRQHRYKLNGIQIRNAAHIADDFYAESPIRLESVTIEHNVRMGKYSYMLGGRIYSDTQIGRYCSIAANVVIGGLIHPQNWLSTNPFQYEHDLQYLEDNMRITFVGNDVWIGANSYIKAGITVGDGAIIGSGAVVIKDIPPYAIVVGVPARVLRYRFDKQTIQRLLELKWWDKDISELQELPHSNVFECLEKLEANWKRC